MKNYRNWLHSSRPSGARNLMYRNDEVTWTHLEDVYKQETKRVQSSQPRTVCLTKDVVSLSHFDKLNVPRALKVFDSRVTAELKSMQHKAGHNKYEGTIKFLDVGRTLFTEFLLKSNVVIDNSNNKEYMDICDKTWDFFTEWKCDWEYFAADDIVYHEKTIEDVLPQFLHSLSYMEILSVCKCIPSFTKQYFTYFPNSKLFIRRLNQDALEGLFAHSRRHAGSAHDMTMTMYCASMKTAALQKQASLDMFVDGDDIKPTAPVFMMFNTKNPEWKDAISKRMKLITQDTQ